MLWTKDLDRELSTLGEAKKRMSSNALDQNSSIKRVGHNLEFTCKLAKQCTGHFKETLHEYILPKSPKKIILLEKWNQQENILNKSLSFTLFADHLDTKFTRSNFWNFTKNSFLNQLYRLNKKDRACRKDIECAREKKQVW